MTRLIPRSLTTSDPGAHCEIAMPASRSIVSRGGHLFGRYWYSVRVRVGNPNIGRSPASASRWLRSVGRQVVVSCDRVDCSGCFVDDPAGDLRSGSLELRICSREESFSDRPDLGFLLLEPGFDLARGCLKPVSCGAELAVNVVSEVDPVSCYLLRTRGGGPRPGSSGGRSRAAACRGMASAAGRR